MFRRYCLPKGFKSFTKIATTISRLHPQNFSVIYSYLRNYRKNEPLNQVIIFIKGYWVPVMYNIGQPIAESLNEILAAWFGGKTFCTAHQDSLHDFDKKWDISID